MAQAKDIGGASVRACTAAQIVIKDVPVFLSMTDRKTVKTGARAREPHALSPDPAQMSSPGFTA